jgi:hypothetical protein
MVVGLLIVLVPWANVHGFELNSPRVFLPQSFAACRVPPLSTRLSQEDQCVSQEDHTEDKYV